MSKQDAPAKYYCFTLNNYVPADMEFIEQSSHLYTYACYGVELGEGGTPHLQGYVQMANKVRITWLKKNFLQRAHYEVSRGTPTEASDYCKKDGRFFEFGTITVQGQRRDLEKIGAAIVGGESVSKLAASDPAMYIKYHKGLRALEQTTVKPRNFKTKVYWYYGATGTGKSKKASEEHPDAYWKDPTSKWWDGYEGEDVIIDDYRRDFCTFASLLRLFDRYPLQLEYKGGTTQFRSKVIVVTTPKDPRATWEGRSEEDIEQLLRRIEVVEEFGENPVYPMFASSFNPAN